MGVVLDIARELERQDFAGADTASVVPPPKASYFHGAVEAVEFP